MGFGRKRIYFLKVLATCGWLLIYGNVFADEAADINNSFNEYKKSIVRTNSLQAVGLVSQSTIDYYSAAKKLALTAKADKLKRLPFSQKMFVLTLRMRMSKSKLQSMDGRELFMHAVSSGWISKSSVENSALGKVRITGNTAYVDYVNKGKPSKTQFVFVKENGVWKFDLVSVMNEADKLFTAAAHRANVSEDKMVETLIEKATGRKVTPALWNGF